jgi:hypothetical protein
LVKYDGKSFERSGLVLYDYNSVGLISALSILDVGSACEVFEMDFQILTENIGVRMC